MRAEDPASRQPVQDSVEEDPGVINREDPNLVLEETPETALTTGDEPVAETEETGDALAEEEAELVDGTEAEALAETALEEPTNVQDILNEDEELESETEPESVVEANALDEEAEALDAREETVGLDAETLLEKVEPEAPAKTAALSDEELFPSSPALEKQKAFWIKIFTEHNSHQGLIHDGRIALPIYESMDLTGMSYRQQKRVIRRRKKELAAGLRGLADAMEAGREPDAEGQRLLDLLPENLSPGVVRDFARNLRFQRGLSNRFGEGIIRSGRYFDNIRGMLASQGVPEDLVYLPHVESSYNYKTYSKIGAAGIWQFTRGTGRMYMRIGYELDERLDPIIASKAAAKFLRQNYERLGSWPLAITAYNHGPGSLERIVAKMGTNDLSTLVQEYEGRGFKFASKNFYAEFLAARYVARNYRKYFGDITLEQPLKYREVRLPFYVDIVDIAKSLKMKVSQLREYNKGLRYPVWSSSKLIPKDYLLRIPEVKEIKDMLAAIPTSAKHKKQKATTMVRVRRGDSLYKIGRRHGIPWRLIAQANNIAPRGRIMPGQRLILPIKGASLPKKVRVAAVKSAPQPAKAKTIIPAESQSTIRTVTADIFTPGELPAAKVHDLKVGNHDSVNSQGEIVAAYGETLGFYSDWAGVSIREIRLLNGMSSRSRLRPGRTLLIPLDAVSVEEFDSRRLEYHKSRMEDFFSTYAITAVTKIKIRRGQSMWNIAQSNNVPMWLFYRENPNLLTQPARVGMEVVLPVVQAVAASSTN